MLFPLQEYVAPRYVRVSVTRHWSEWTLARASWQFLRSYYHHTRTVVYRPPAGLTCDVVRDLGLYLDSELQMKRHVNKVVSLCYYHLRRCFNSGTLLANRL